MFSSLFQSMFGRNSLIAPDDIWGLLAVLSAGVGTAIILEQKYRWASALSGVVMSMLIGMLLSNLAILPTQSVFYDDIIWSYAVPLGIPLLLLRCNIRKIWAETGRILILFIIGSAGTFCGAFLAYSFFHKLIPELAGVTAMMIGTYTGGSMNLSVLAGIFSVSGKMVGSATVADNMLMALYFLVLIFCSGRRFFLNRFSHPHIEEVRSTVDFERGSSDDSLQSAPITIKDIAVNIMYSAMVVWISEILAYGLNNWIPDDTPVWQMIHTLFTCFCL